jgi:hypothetical protein
MVLLRSVARGLIASMRQLKVLGLVAMSAILRPSAKGETVDTTSSFLTNRYHVVVELVSSHESFWSHDQLQVWSRIFHDTTEGEAAVIVTEARNATSADLTPLDDSLLLIGVRYGDSSPPTVLIIAPLWKKVSTMELWDGGLTPEFAQGARVIDSVVDSMLVAKIWKYPNAPGSFGISVSRNESVVKPHIFVLGSSGVHLSYRDYCHLSLSINWGNGPASECLEICLPGKLGCRSVTISRCATMK